MGWGEWTSDGGYSCSDEEGAKTTYTRKRECKKGASKVLDKCFSTKSGTPEKSEEEKYEVAKPRCDQPPQKPEQQNR